MTQPTATETATAYLSGVDLTGLNAEQAKLLEAFVAELLELSEAFGYRKAITALRKESGRSCRLGRLGPPIPSRRRLPGSDRRGGQVSESTMETCPHCGTTIIKYDPPLVFDAEQACGQIKPGTYTPNGMPASRCDLVKGHDGEHIGLMEWEERWP